MKQNRIALLCMLLPLFMLLGCAKQAEATIPDGWIEYSLEDKGMKIALPPQYVAMGAGGLLPTDADFERAGIVEKDRGYHLEQMRGYLAIKDVVFTAISYDYNVQRMTGMVVRLGEIPGDVQEQLADADQENTDQLRHYTAQMVEEFNKTDEPHFVIGEDFQGLKHKFVTHGRVVDSSRFWHYTSIYHGRYFEMIFSTNEDTAELRAESDQVAYWLRVE